LGLFADILSETEKGELKDLNQGQAVKLLVFEADRNPLWQTQMSRAYFIDGITF
jgi:hypothetical protein